MSAEPTLDNCAHEPIHIPGLIQPHGALLAFDVAGLLAYVSANASSMLGMVAKLGAGIEQQELPAAVVAHLRLWVDNAGADYDPLELTLNGIDFDVVGHRNVDELLIVEFEIRNLSSVSVASFAVMAQKAISRLRRQKNVEDLLGLAAAEMRKITGFDRVMAYRFRHDDSGEVVRESRREDLEDWQGRRYPSGDIPAQARRLYTLNTLRLIADVSRPDVAVEAGPPAHPVDMSFCVLRSVSPIHIEYLNNMGVAASLSVSIVIDGKLWGMLACHHGMPRHPPHGIRMACDVLGQVLSITIASLETADAARRLVQATQTLALIGTRVRAADDLLAGIALHSPTPADLLDADATVCLWGGNAMVCGGAVPSDMLTALAAALESQDVSGVKSTAIARTHPALAAIIAPYCGLLAVCFDDSHGGWVVWLRAEQIEKVRWAGEPAKVIKIGPNGPRLTPRGSFSEWLELVRGSSIPWQRGEIETAEALRLQLHSIAGAHATERERGRLELLASLGHDLRDPLHAISMAAHILQHPAADGIGLGARIQSSSGRMSRLVTQILDMSMLQSKTGIVLSREEFDLVALLREAVSDMMFAHPDMLVSLNMPEILMISADRDRLAQVIANLMSNARHHGTPGQPILVFAQDADARASFGVSNVGAAIAAEVQRGLFKAFKPESSSNPRNRTGLGLGLYIASELVKAHDGTLSLECRAGQIIFTAEFAAASGTAKSPATPR
jgi:chemotaxis family two-component system sensor kinase Cph1